MNGKKTLLVAHILICVLSDASKNFKSALYNNWVRNYLFLKNYITAEGADSHNVLYYQQEGSELLDTK